MGGDDWTKLIAVKIACKHRRKQKMQCINFFGLAYVHYGLDVFFGK